jgi:hypothetical protein
MYNKDLMMEGVDTLVDRICQLIYHNDWLKLSKDVAESAKYFESVHRCQSLGCNRIAEYQIESDGVATYDVDGKRQAIAVATNYFCDEHLLEYSRSDTSIVMTVRHTYVAQYLIDVLTRSGKFVGLENVDAEPEPEPDSCPF